MGRDRDAGAGIKVFCFFSSEKKTFLVIAHPWLILEDADLQSLSGQVPYR
jgi:hypothetical protein